MTDYLRIDPVTGTKKERASAVQVSTGAPDANKLVATGANGKIDGSLLPASEEFGREASEALAALDFVNVFDDGGTAKVRKADGSAFATRATGYVLDNYVATDTAQIFGEGIMAGFAGLTIGAPVFLSQTTPGAITQSPSLANAGGTDVWQVLGEAVSATEVRVEIGDAICL